MKSPRDFFKPLAAGAPDPVHEIPFPPSRMIHFFDPSNEKMRGKVPDMAAKSDILLGNLEDAISADNKEAARAGLIEVGKTVDFKATGTGFWTRINSLDSPWVLDDLTELVTRDRRQARRDHDARRSKARGTSTTPTNSSLSSKRRPASKAAALPRDSRNRAGRRPRRGDRPGQPAHAGHVARPGGPRREPPHEDHPRRRRPPRLHRRSTTRATRKTSKTAASTPSRTRGTTRSPAWSTPAPANGILPFYGPFGDIKDTVACEVQFRSAFLLGCVGTWSLHPAQIEIATQGLLARRSTRCSSPRRCSKRSRTARAST